ncbi:DUF6680 family protein [Marinobacter sp. LV10R520-4]|uniref:DUF6680 family protein n=1 Tax=Marinobacter sp. LV10R520-4 TaxID=1761796 RepID=UPI00117D8CAE|nr:DUF6680 family protein [Marinobacter sp. LV10R520-4]
MTSPQGTFTPLVYAHAGRTQAHVVGLVLCFTPNQPQMQALYFIKEITLTQEGVIVTIIASLLSGIIGVAISSWFYYRLERHKLKVDLARRLLGYRFSISGEDFSCAMNQVIAVFADSPEVLQKMERLYQALEVSGKPHAESALIDFLKAVCKYSGLTQATLNDAYLLKTFNARN